MKLTCEADPVCDRLVVTLVINMEDLDCAQFTAFDRKLIEECSGDETSIADKLLALETIVRRIEESK